VVWRVEISEAIRGSMIENLKWMRCGDTISIPLRNETRHLAEGYTPSWSGHSAGSIRSLSFIAA
jgi:hypothetical protein